MRRKFYRPSAAILLTGLIAICISPSGLVAKNDGAKEAYSMEVLALKGPATTDVYATFSTVDPDAFPIPGVLKKLQAKIKDDEGEVAFLKNDWDVEVVNGTATMSAPEPAPHVMLYVQAHIKTGKREVVIMDQAPVRMRPDLVVENVNAPAEVHVDAPFNVEAVIHELNGQVGTTATLNLFHGSQLLASVAEVAVGAGDVTSVVIAGVTFPEPGTYYLSFNLTGADPGEYDDTNNSYEFTVEVIQPYNFQNSSYYFYYYNQHYTTNQVVDYTCQMDYVYDYEYHYDYGYIVGTSYGDTPEAPIESFSWSYSTEDGEWGSNELSNLYPAWSSPSYDQYYLYDPDFGIQIYIYVVPSSGYTYYYTYHNSYGYSYIYNYADGTTSEYEYNYYGMDHMDAHEYLTATILINDNAVTLGGSATMNLSGWQNTNSYTGGYPYGTCPYTYTTTYDNHTSSGNTSGTLDPSVLFKGRIIADGVELPRQVSLDDAYPNPFNPSTMIRIALPDAAPVSLIIYDLVGSEVARLVDGYIEAGHHEFRWNGKMTSGAVAPTGIYLARMITPGYNRTIKMVMVK